MSDYTDRTIQKLEEYEAALKCAIREAIVALLKSVAAPCEPRCDEEDHAWRKCRHCLAVQELERTDIRRMLGAFLEAIAVVDKDYGKTV